MGVSHLFEEVSGLWTERGGRDWDQKAGLKVLALVLGVKQGKDVIRPLVFSVRWVGGEGGRPVRHHFQFLEVL